MNAEARVALSWADGRSTRIGSVALTADGIEPDEALDALLAGLAATTGRTYTIEKAVIVEPVERAPVLPEGARRPAVPARPVRTRPVRPSVPGAPVDAPGRSQGAPGSPESPAPSGTGASTP